MLHRIKNFIPLDGFALTILASMGLANLFPVSQQLSPCLDITASLGIGLIFFLYGARLRPQETLTGLKHWQLQTFILTFTFIVIPCVAVALAPLSRHILSPELSTGILLLALLPSTVQTAVSFTATARGNVPAAVISASLSNIIGIFLTPLVVTILMSLHLLTATETVSLHLSTMSTIVVHLLVPFLLGQLMHRWIQPWLQSHSAFISFLDRSVIAFVVYLAFSYSVRQNIWHVVNPQQLMLLIICTVLIIIFFSWLSYQTACLARFNRSDRITIQFCGTQKSLTTGVPIVMVLTAHEHVGLIILPLVIYYQAQLILGSILANKYHNEDMPKSTTTLAPPTK